jgi:hypothetical protein
MVRIQSLPIEYETDRTVYLDGAEHRHASASRSVEIFSFSFRDNPHASLLLLIAKRSGFGDTVSERHRVIVRVGRRRRKSTV